MNTFYYGSIKTYDNSVSGLGNGSVVLDSVLSNIETANILGKSGVDTKITVPTNLNIIHDEVLENNIIKTVNGNQIFLGNSLYNTYVDGAKIENTKLNIIDGKITINSEFSTNEKPMIILNDYKTFVANTVQQFTTGTIEIILESSLVQADDYYNNWFLFRKDKTQILQIIDYVNSTNTITLSGGIDSNIELGDLYTLSQEKISNVITFDNSTNSFIMGQSNDYSLITPGKLEVNELTANTLNITGSIDLEGLDIIDIGSLNSLDDISGISLLPYLGNEGLYKIFIREKTNNSISLHSTVVATGSGNWSIETISLPYEIAAGEFIEVSLRQVGSGPYHLEFYHKQIPTTVNQPLNYTLKIIY